MAKKVLLFTVIAAVLAGYFLLGGNNVLSIDMFQQAYRDNPLASAGLFFLVYFLAAAFSLPAAALLTVAAGLIFDLWVGTLLVSFASSLGATVACLFSRYLLRDWVQSKLGKYLGRINRGLERDGATYLFTLRLIPIFPFWVLNLAFGLTRLPLGRFYLASQLGMLPGTLVYVNAGAQLGNIDELSVQGVLTPGVLGAFALLAVFPWLARQALALWRRRRVYRGFSRPDHFDTNMVVIGAGSGGLVTAYLAAALKARVTLVERGAMGGDCLNTGCVPSKALLRAARAAEDARRAGRLGVETGDVRVDFRRVMAHVHTAVETIAPHDSVERYTSLGVDCVQGSARLEDPWTVVVGEQRIRARQIVIATGARPRLPEVPGLADVDYLTSETLWSLNELPARLLVVGGGPVGCEMAQAFQRLGASVTLVQRRDQLLPALDREAAELLRARLEGEGVQVLTSTHLQRFEVRGQTQAAVVAVGQGDAANTSTLSFDKVLLAAGRQANTEDLGLDRLGIACRDDGTVEVDQYQRTAVPNILACGDVCGPFQFTHASSHQAWYAAVNGLFGRFWKFRNDNSLIPSVVYTEPEIAAVGLTEAVARAQGKDVEVTRYDMGEADRAIAEGMAEGFIKVITPRGKDRILGVTIVAPHAGEMLMEFVAAIKSGKGLNHILGTIHPYPVFSEANKLAAGQWKRNHTPQKLLDWVARYHRSQLR